ncbi:MAG: hypothetical protein LCH38_13250 [Proteobacteria bacterium]|nr:hypothetical protein [Pseudomonadota bacterium]
MKFLKILAAAFFLGNLCHVAVAETISVNVPAGKRSAVTSFGSYSIDECTGAAVPEGRISRQPANGKLEVVEERRPMKAGRCGTIMANVLVVYYTPKAGFRGSDEGTVDFTSQIVMESSQIRSRSLYLTISVK